MPWKMSIELTFKNSCRGSAGAVIDWEDPKIKEEVLRMIAAYLQGEGYVASSMMLMDEANLRRSELKKAQLEQQQWSKKVKKEKSRK
jgi:hypothetical protein